MNKNLRLLLILVLLTIAAGILWFMNGGKGRISSNPLTDFMIEDTAAVDKIFIADTDGRTITLERDPDSRYWDLNDDFKARKDAVDLLLKTFKRIRVKSPIPDEAKANVIRLLASSGKKVEIYQGGPTPVKTYIVGNATQDHTGTYMLLETEGDGRSTEPFITHMEGFTGFLSTRFFTDLEEWKYTGVFDYPDFDISEISVSHHEAPEKSFTIKYAGGNDIELYSNLLKKKVEVFDTLRVKDYMLLYKKVHCETHMSHLTPAQEDSLLNTSPAYSLSVLNNSGERKKIDLYYKKPVKDIYDEAGNLQPYDMARMFGVIEGDDVVLIQLFVFDALLKGIGTFALQ